MWFFSPPPISNVILSFLCLTWALGGNAYPNSKANYQEANSALSPRGIETKESYWSSTRNQLDSTGEVGGKENTRIKNLAIDSTNNIPLNNNPEGKDQKQRSDPVSESQVIPKDPNSFFHAASLRQFKSSVASFKAWQRLHFFPDTHRLAHDKVQDVATEIDNFIEEISSAHHSHRSEN